MTSPGTICYSALILSEAVEWSPHLSFYLGGGHHIRHNRHPLRKIRAKCWIVQEHDSIIFLEEGVTIGKFDLYTRFLYRYKFGKESAARKLARHIDEMFSETRTKMHFEVAV